jgi:hypothetical protein
LPHMRQHGCIDILHCCNHRVFLGQRGHVAIVGRIPGLWPIPKEKNRKYVSYGFPIINFCNPGFRHEKHVQSTLSYPVSCYTQTTLNPHTNRLVLCKEIVFVYSENHAKRMDVLWIKCIVSTIKACGTYSYRCV